jgi:hypothetical protein
MLSFHGPWQKYSTEVLVDDFLKLFILQNMSKGNDEKQEIFLLEIILISFCKVSVMNVLLKIKLFSSITPTGIY